jgi:RNA polymerase sigma factor (sigma-70 family)
MPRFDGDSSGLRSFLFTLAYRRIADDHRTKFRRREQLVADHEPTVDGGIDIENAFTSHEDAAEAMRALDILDDRERRVVELRIIEEASPAEVADVLGLSNGNVRVIQARALVKIRKYLESRTGAMPSITLVPAFLKGLRSELPADGALAAWIERLQSTSTGAVKTVAAGAGTAIAAGAASTTTVAGTILKIGLVAALATASTATVEPAVADHPLADGASATPVVVPVVAEPEPPEHIRPHALDHETNSNFGVAIAPNRPNLVPPANVGTEEPTSPTDATVTEPESEAAGTVIETSGGGSSGPSEVSEPIDGGDAGAVVNEVFDTVEEVVNGLVKTVETVVDTVNTGVTDVVDEAEDVVDDTMSTVNDTVNNTVDTVNDTVNETTVAVNDTVETVVNDVSSVVSGAVGGLGGFLGG